MTQPSFSTPVEALAFLHNCLEKDDSNEFYSAFSEETSSFWRDHIFNDMKEIDQTETLQQAFLEEGEVLNFIPDATVLHLGGHNLHARYINIKIERKAGHWQLVSIYVCR